MEVENFTRIGLTFSDGNGVQLLEVSLLFFRVIHLEQLRPLVQLVREGVNGFEQNRNEDLLVINLFVDRSEAKDNELLQFPLDVSVSGETQYQASRWKLFPGRKTVLWDQVLLHQSRGKKHVLVFLTRKDLRFLIAFLILNFVENRNVLVLGQTVLQQEAKDVVVFPLGALEEVQDDLHVLHQVQLLNSLVVDEGTVSRYVTRLLKHLGVIQVQRTNLLLLGIVLLGGGLRLLFLGRGFIVLDYYIWVAIELLQLWVSVNWVGLVLISVHHVWIRSALLNRTVVDISVFGDVSGVVFSVGVEDWLFFL